MALQIIPVLLFTVFFSEALTLMCYDCIRADSECLNTENCTSQDEQCSSITTYIKGMSKNKGCTAVCSNESVNVVQIGMTSKCCDSDLCNNDAQDSPNKMMCYYCTDKNCSNTLGCKGDERQCITVTAESDENTTTTFKGCASKSVCDNTELLQQQQLLQLIGKIKSASCCGENLCNSVQSLTQGAVLLLVPMLPVLFSI
ncbi:hypothetical protein Q8A67_021220 [Cirrhinus molitorella]|uniref:UPAR/Ly6 domain-containing protein n=1 Tax=Cirrhinus molitorella TaxID=172907 RepID=A0AA88P9I9_9TELE|nr:hypothetical protein Q8A67_021220 [Cirrhinus molitorella]